MVSSLRLSSLSREVERKVGFFSLPQTGLALLCHQLAQNPDCHFEEPGKEKPREDMQRFLDKREASLWNR